MAWYDENPTLLSEELAALAESGHDYQIDEKARSEGRLTIEVSYEIESKTHKFICEYPATYPYFAVKIKCSSFPPGRHLDPVSGTICIFEDEQSVWDPSPGGDNLAKVIDNQVPIILERHRSPNTKSKDEGNVGYQITGQLPCEPNSVIFVDDWPKYQIKDFGKMALMLKKEKSPENKIIGCLSSLEGIKNTLEVSDSTLHKYFKQDYSGRYVVLNKLPKNVSPKNLLNKAFQIWPELKSPNFKKTGFDITGLLIPEESNYHTNVYNWIFVVRRRQNKKQTNKAQIDPSFVRSDRYTPDNILQRTPRLRAIRNKKVIIFGAGALGSHIAWQLARAGVDNLMLVDHDIVQAGNISRWLLGFMAIGKLKVEILREFIAHNFPEVKCEILPIKIGVNQTYLLETGPVDSHEFIKSFIQGADLVVDAIAETNVSLYLSNLCQETTTPYVWATGTQGAWGGIVGRVVPNITDGTWTDFSKHYDSGQISAPPAEEHSDIQPVGCFHQTFTGSGFDLDNISIMTTRLVISILANGKEDGYPNFDWDVGVLHLWDEKTGNPIATKWETHKLKKFK